MVVEGEAGGVGAGLHVGAGEGALALAAVVGEGQRAAEGATEVQFNTLKGYPLSYP